MKKEKGTKHTLHLPGPEDATLCGKPIANSILWSKKSPPTKPHPGLCRKCCAELLKAKTGAVETEAKKNKRTPGLFAIQNCPSELVVTYKGETYKATVNPDGTISVNGKNFNSPSRAGKEITGREVDGWTFWNYEAGAEGLKKLNTLRKETA